MTNYRRPTYASFDQQELHDLLHSVLRFALCHEGNTLGKLTVKEVLEDLQDYADWSLEPACKN